MRSLNESVYQTMTLEPLRTALSASDVGETSLALPSDRGVRSAQQRVLDQVSTLKRTRSKYRSASASGTLSPTSPPFDGTFNDHKFIYNWNGLEGSANGHIKTKHGYKYKTISSWGSSGQRFPASPPPISNPRIQTDGFAGTINSKKISKGERKPTTPTTPTRPGPGGQNPGNGTLIHPPSGGFGIDEKRTPDITLKEAVDCIQSTDENYQLCGASYIQHCTFTDDKAKKEVLKLGAVPRLVSLMGSPSPPVQQTSAAALRNLVFKDRASKEEVHRAGGVTQASQLLHETESSETQRHVTGLLWNLSSVDTLKPDLLRHALPCLTQSVLEPFSGTSDLEVKRDVDAETFYNATGCLRNLSCGKQVNRQAMRNCKGLVDSLSTYVQNYVAEGDVDDKSLENCVCILHNLTYQLETESPAVFSKINALASHVNRNANAADTGPISCFSGQSRKIQESHFDYPVMEESSPKGQNWLIHSRALQSYLTLMGTSENEAIREACCGTLQNLTASKGLASDVLSQTIVQKLNGLRQISPLLESDNSTMKNHSISLLGNLSRSPRLHNAMARQALPQLVRSLSSATQGAALSPESDNTTATACNVLSNLIRAEPELAKPLLNSSLINSLNNLSLNTNMPGSSKAAGVLLHSLWSDKNIQSVLRRQGLNKKSFVNDITSAAIKSVQVIE
ncbi:plakophilin-1 isoform X2 [Brachyhypopomus gauderio]|uniref:plakophilin-1 isoform X2 n=1 Tax=Brachyhypopomus gauderio TaxID=698409 RepID=UPI0040433764